MLACLISHARALITLTNLNYWRDGRSEAQSSPAKDERGLCADARFFTVPLYRTDHRASAVRKSEPHAAPAQKPTLMPKLTALHLRFPLAARENECPGALVWSVQIEN